MKKKFLKFFAVLACLVMVMSVTAFAADSPSTGGNSGTSSPSAGDNSGTGSPSAGNNTADSSSSTTSNDPYQVPATDKAQGVTANKITVNGTEVAVTVNAASKADVANAEAIAKVYCGDKAEVVNVFDITVPAGDYSAGVDVTMNVPGVKAGDTIAVLHWNAQKGIWENLAVTNVADGSVTATFTSFSPVAIVRTEAAPSTGYEAPVALIAVLVVAAAGAAFCVRRRAIAE